jgi:cytochrome P450
MTSDIRAVSHVILNNSIYDTLASNERPLPHAIGSGLFVVHGEQHRIQRKAINPAFGSTQLRALTGVFLDKANEASPDSS